MSVADEQPGRVLYGAPVPNGQETSALLSDQEITGDLQQCATADRGVSNFASQADGPAARHIDGAVEQGEIGIAAANGKRLGVTVAAVCAIQVQNFSVEVEGGLSVRDVESPHFEVAGLKKIDGELLAWKIELCDLVGVRNIATHPVRSDVEIAIMIIVVGVLALPFDLGDEGGGKKTTYERQDPTEKVK